MEHNRLESIPGVPFEMSSKVEEPLNLVPVTEDEVGQQNGAVNGTSNGTSNGVNGDSTKTSRFDPNFTDAVIKATGPKASPRTREVFSSLIRHLHDFARETELTVDEWMAAVDLVC